MKAVIYTRVSSDPSGRAQSVAQQETECRALCAREGWAVERVLVDNDIGASRWSRKDRPAYRELQTVLSSGDVGVLVTWEASRAQRDLKAFVQLRDLCAEKGVLWSYSGRTYDLSHTDDRMSTGLDALLAEREADVTRGRVLRALRDRVDKGLPHGKLAYGYRRVIDPQTGETIGRVPDEVTSPVVREMARRALAGESLASVAADLNRRGVPAPRPAKDGSPVLWTGQQVKRIVVSPTYAGKRVHKGHVVGDAVWKAIIPERDHLTLRARLTDPSRLTHSDSTVKHLLAGIAVCGVCGALCRRVKNRQTPSYSCGENHCVARAEKFVDEYVTAVVIERLSRPDLADLLAGDDQAARDALDESRALRARLETFYDAAAQGDLTPAALSRIEAGILPKIDAAQRRATAGTSAPLLGAFITADPATTWEALTIPQRRELVRLLMVPVIRRTQQGARKLDPESIEIRWRQS